MYLHVELSTRQQDATLPTRPVSCLVPSTSGNLESAGRPILSVTVEHHNRASVYVDGVKPQQTWWFSYEQIMENTNPHKHAKKPISAPISAPIHSKIPMYGHCVFWWRWCFRRGVCLNRFIDPQIHPLILPPAHTQTRTGTHRFVL